MLFTNTLSLLSLAALALSAPHPQQGTSELEERLAAPALTWKPRSLDARGNGNNNNNNNNNNDFITITETDVEQITEIQRGQEVQLTVAVEKQIKIIDQKKRAQDNVRLNHYRNKNSNQNTVIVIVTQVIDIRDQSNVNTRYMSRQIRANNNNNFQETVVVVSEIEAITIGGNSNNNNNGNGNNQNNQGQTKTESPNQQAQQASATAAALSSIQTYDPSAPFQASNQTQILPSGAAAPNWGQTVEQDPAAIIEDNQAAFVEFAQQS